MRKLQALVLSAHPGPSVAVGIMPLVLGIGVGLEPWRIVLVTLAVVVNQFSVGLSNDWIDADRDRATGRTDKPVAQGLVEASTVRTAAIVLALVSIAATLPLGWPAVVAHAVFLVSGWAYNAGAKRLAISVLPYIVGFGALPLIVTLARPEPALASPWVILAAALLGVAAHFGNALPDLEDDRATGVMGLPHRVGARTTGLTIAGALAAASASIVLELGNTELYAWIGLGLSVLLAAGCAVLVITARPTRLIFRLVIAGALIDVALLALSGSRILA